MIHPDAVSIRIVDREELTSKLNELPRVDEAFKNRILNPLPVVEASLCDLAQTLSTRRSGGGDIISDEEIHT